MYSSDINKIEGIGGPGSFCRGISQTPNGLLCIGTSSGKILLISGGKDWKLDRIVEGHKRPIVFIDYNSKHIISCDDSGVVIVWDDKMNDIISKFESADSCTSCFMKDDTVVVSYTSGHIRLFKLHEGLRMEICAHSRCITALCCHPTENYFASCGEDSVVNVYSLPNLDSKDCTNVEIKLSAHSADHLLSGIQFSKGSHVAAVSYDTCALDVWYKQ